MIYAIIDSLLSVKFLTEKKYIMKSHSEFLAVSGSLSDSSS